MSKEPKNPVGAPTTYTLDIANEICSYIAQGESMRTVVKRDTMPAMSTIFKWLREHPEFTEQYARACEERTEAMAEDIIDIADSGENDTYIDEESGRRRTDNDVIQRSKLRVETRKWLMAKMKPKKYGDKIDVTTGGEKLTTAPLIVSDVGDGVKVDTNNS